MLKIAVLTKPSDLSCLRILLLTYRMPVKVSVCVFATKPSVTGQWWHEYRIFYSVCIFNALAYLRSVAALRLRSVTVSLLLLVFYSHTISPVMLWLHGRSGPAYLSTKSLLQLSG